MKRIMAMFPTDNTYKEIADEMRAARSVLIFPHINPDGDALGSAGAICAALRKLGKEAFVFVDKEYPRNLDFLENGFSITNNNELNIRADLAIMVDCSGKKRIGERYKTFAATKKKILIDHHEVTEGDVEADYGRIEGDSAATGEMIFLLIKALDVELDLYMAGCIFAAITTDTGNFQHPNTTKRSHEIVGALYDVKGFNSKVISNLIYNRNSMESMRLEAIVMESGKSCENGEIFIGTVTQEMMRDTGCTSDDIDRFIQKIMTIDGVEIGVLLKETEIGNTKVSLRARSCVDVASIAAEFGGGGHLRAAGFSLNGVPESSVDIILPKLKEAIIKKTVG